jgi:glycolate oxidase iron-sulfur subunit
MQTRFSPEQLADPRLREAEAILRKCVHCGFCLTACPTYAVLGDERDSPRGRIYLIQNMLEAGGPPTVETVRHVDRCLSCLGCVAACPSGVDYMHLIDQARAYIEDHHRRPFADRWMRTLVSWVLPHPRRFRAALAAARLARPFAALLPGRLRRMVETAPRRIDEPANGLAPQTFAAIGPRRKRVALLTGCVQQVLGSRINEATVRVLQRVGCEVVVADGAGCCGALTHHLGYADAARSTARHTLAAWWQEDRRDPLDAVVINASGCGTTVKDYGHLFAGDSEWELAAQRIASIARDVTEILADLGVEAAAPAEAPAIAYHDSCSLQHGQRLSAPPRALLVSAGFDVREVAEGHMCCGSAGSYNLLQPALSDALGVRKGGHIAATGARAVACGNLGCMLQIERFGGLPAVHTVELIDWATGGPVPAPLRST